jgi:hypothetical protein
VSRMCLVIVEHKFKITSECVYLQYKFQCLYLVLKLKIQPSTLTYSVMNFCHVRWVPCHNSMAYPWLQMEGQPPAMAGGCEYIE